MDSILPALLAVTIMLLASLMLGRSSFTSFQVLGDAWQDAEDRAVERVRSDIAITSVTVTGTRVDATVRNDGATQLIDFSRMDLVIQYQAGTSNYIKYLPYTASSPPAADMWTVTSITNDVIDPGVVDTGESMNIRIELNPAVGTGTTNWLQLTTELGISASLFFVN